MHLIYFTRCKSFWLNKLKQFPLFEDIKTWKEELNIE